MVTFKEDYYLKHYSGRDILIAWGLGVATALLLVAIPFAVLLGVIK